MSTIERITVQTYEYRLEDFGPNIATYTPGVAMDVAKFVVTIETAADYARAGADVISIGALTHSRRWVDIGLDYVG